MIKPSGRMTPLWVIMAFVSLSETTFGYAAIKTAGGIQVSFTVFAIVFAFLVAVAFFCILWFKPFVFYAPSEYGDADPQAFVNAISGATSPRVAQQVELVRMVERNPEDKNAQHHLINSLLDQQTRQCVILMREKGLAIPYLTDFNTGIHYSYGTKNKFTGSGTLRTADFYKQLEGTKFVEIAEKQRIIVRLTADGNAFADWLIKNGQKAEFMETPFGGWGTPFKEVVGCVLPEPPSKNATDEHHA